MISMDKKYRTRDGQSVTLLSTSARGPRPVLGHVGATGDMLYWWTAAGGYVGDNNSVMDLVEAIEPRTGYINIYEVLDEEVSIAMMVHKTRSIADKQADDSRVGCIRIELVEGRYDE